MSRVLVTGAAGSLGHVLVPLLAEQGHLVRQLDLRPAEPGHEMLIGDVRDPDVLAQVVDGADAVVHCAAIHGVHLDAFSPAEFWDLDATGTFAVYDAARVAGTVSKVVLCSSMAVYGQSAQSTEDGWAVVSDDSPVLPLDAYGLSKHAAENLARDAARVWGIQTVALRLGMFVPETFDRYGVRLLFGGVDDRDVATACLAALSHRPAAGFDSFNVFSTVPFGPDEAHELGRDPWAVVERYFPGTADIVDARHLDRDELMWGWAIWSTEKARRLLGWQPVYDFARFLDAWKTDDRALYPFADRPRWGVPPP